MGSRSKSNQSSSSQNVNSNQGVNSSVGMNFGTNQSGNSSQGSSSQSVWGTQTPYLEDVYGQAQDQYGQAIGTINDLQPGVQDQVTDAFNQGMGGYGNQMGGGFASGLQNQIGPNAYEGQMKDMIAQDAMKLQQQSLGGLDARAAAAGMSGSSGYRDQVTATMDDINQNAQNAMANVGYQGFNQGIQNQMNLAGMMDRNQQGAMANMGAMQQGAMNQFNPAMAGMNAAGAYGQIIGGPTTLTQSQQSSNGFSNGMNAGMNMSGGFNNGYGYGASNGQGSSSSTTLSPEGAGVGLKAISMLPFSSDARLKENIEHVEQIDGVNMYTWEWKDEAMSSPMNYGVIAQEVAETHPEAVMEGDHGYLMVDYSKLGRAGEVALARMEG